MMRPDVVLQNRHQLNTHKAKTSKESSACFSAAGYSVDKLSDIGSLLQNYDSGFAAKINNQKDLEAGL